MRRPLLALVLFGALAAAPLLPAGSAVVYGQESVQPAQPPADPAPADAPAQAEPQAQPGSAQQPAATVDVDVDRDTASSAWYFSPVWIAIGAIALVVLIVLIVMASRSRETTVVR